MMRAKIATCALLLACSVQLNAASLPGQGASMNQVEQDLGSPLSKTGPVGKPPITRWTYDGFVVVFERNKVLHSMTVTGQRPAPRPAAPVRAPAPVKAPALAAPAPAAAVQKPATPAATPVAPAQVDGAEQARRQAERDAAKARADADAAKTRAAQEADAAEALRKPVEAAPEAATPQAAPAPAPAPAPATATPAPEAAPAPKRTAEDALKAAPGFSFDPATGRVILK